MPAFFRFFIIAATMMGLATSVLGRQFLMITTPRSHAVSWSHHRNRLGVEAYLQGGAFVANTGSVTAMLFNPASLAQMPGRLTVTIETGWASETEYLRFFDVDIVSGLQPLQFVGAVFQAWRKLSIGTFYARPTHYTLSEAIEILNADFERTGEFLKASSKRNQTSLGLVLAVPVKEQFYIGGGVEWRRSSFRDETNQISAEGDAEAVRFTAGATLRIKDWSTGISAQTKYKASGDVIFKNNLLLINIDPDPSVGGFNILMPSASRFTNEDPAMIRFGVATPKAFGRLRLNADVEYKDFSSNIPIERWQFYGGGNFQLTSNVHFGFGVFTFAKDYSTYIEGSKSEIFWTVGGAIELAQFRLGASFMDSDLLTQDFAGQQFLNFAIGYAIH